MIHNADDGAAGDPHPRTRVHARACELALKSGRRDAYVQQSDYEQAKREVTGESDMDLQDAILDALDATGRSGLAFCAAGSAVALA